MLKKKERRSAEYRKWARKLKKKKEKKKQIVARFCMGLGNGKNLNFIL
jgi:hypothetical protein